MYSKIKMYTINIYCLHVPFRILSKQCIISVRFTTTSYKDPKLPLACNFLNTYHHRTDIHLRIYAMSMSYIYLDTLIHHTNPFFIRITDHSGSKVVVEEYSDCIVIYYLFFGCHYESDYI